MEMTKTTTMIVNNTSGVLKLKVGGHQHYAEVATIEKQGRHDLHVNVNETYREFVLQAESASSKEKSVIVTSDDCCDYECITIKEAAGSGKFEAHRVARKLQNHGNGHAPEGGKNIINCTLKAGSKSNWFGWLRQLWAPKSPSLQLH